MSRIYLLLLVVCASAVRGGDVRGANSTELRPLDVVVTLDSAEGVQLEVKRHSISREQLLRLSKFLGRKGITVKQVEGGETSERQERQAKQGKQLNLVAEGPPQGKRPPVTAEDILPLLPSNLSSLLPLVHQLETDQCRRHAEHFLLGLHNLTKWAVQMFDAGTKIPEGVLWGSSFHFGNFDECVNIAVELPGQGGQGGQGGASPEVLRGQYCLATATLQGSKEVDAVHSAWDTLKVPASRRGYRKDKIHWALCVPAACSAAELQTFLRAAIDISAIRGLQLGFEVPANMCQVRREVSMDGYDASLLAVFIVFFLLIGIATVYDLAYFKGSSDSQTPKGVLGSVLLCFSAHTNLAKLFAYTPAEFNLDSIFGIKAITMFLILIGHASAFLIGGPSMNSDYKEEAVLKVENGILLNNPLLVDTFLMVGAFLLCRLLLSELDKRGFVNPLVVYGGRIIRLTPAYAVVIAVYCTWLYKADSGPLWEAKVGLERDRCISSWWANLLYINNYVNSEYLCMFQSWYLAVDTHFFFLAPLIIYPLWRWPLVGEVALCLTTLACIAVPFALTYHYQLDPVLMMYAREISDLSSNPMYKTAYIKTHMRGMSYTMGLLLGYVIYRIQSSGYKVPKAMVWCGWVVGSFCSLSAMFSVTVFYYRPYDAFEAAVYAALHRVGWCLGVGWVIFACITGNAGRLNAFLSARAWVPLSRLSYCAYLVNGLVELHTIGTLRHTRYLTNLEIAKETTSHILLTYGLAVFLTTTFEAPIRGLESILLKRAGGGRRGGSQTASSASLGSAATASSATASSA